MDDGRLLLVWGKTLGRNSNATEGHPLALSHHAFPDLPPTTLYKSGRTSGNFGRTTPEVTNDR